MVQADSTADQLRHQSDRQQQVRTQTTGVSDQIDAVISEFERNGLGAGKDVATLKSIRGILGQLDQDQMQRVVALLQQSASATSDLSGAKQAFTLQQDIIGQFRKLLIDYQRQQGLAALAQRIDQLSVRQAANLRAAVDLATTGAPGSTNKSDSRKNGSTQAAMQLQQNEQAQIAAEVTDAMSTARMMLNDAAGSEAEQLGKALSDPIASEAVDQSKTAASDLQTGNLYRAASGEKASRDSLRALAEMLAPPKNALEVKKEQLAALDAIRDKQQDLAQQTQAHPDRFDPHDPSTSLQPLARDQAAAVDATDDAKRKLANTSPKTAAALNQAEQHMQDARGDMNNQARRTAVADEAKSAADLDEARHQLQDEIAKSEQQADNASPTTAPSQDPVAAAKQLAEQIKQLRQEQKVTAIDPHADSASARQQTDQQQQLANAAQDLQQQAAPTSDQAAAALGQAARQMQQASESLKRGRADAAAQKQQAADDALAQAQSAAEKKAAEMAQAQQDLNDLQKAQQQIGQLMQQQAQLAAGSPDAAAQKDLAGKTDQVPASLPAAAQAAAAPLSDAAAQMQDATAQIQKSQTANARTAQVKAIGQLANAEAKVDAAMEQDRAKLGQQADQKPGEDADGQAAIDKAAKEVEKAQDAMTKPDAPGNKQAASDHLQAAAKDAAQAMADDRDGQQKADVQQAIDQIAKSADANAEQKNDQARQSADRAADALAQAKLAIPSLAQQQANAPQPDTQPPDPSNQPPQDQLTGNQASPTGERAAQDAGSRNSNLTGNSFIQLPPRDRAALEQSQAEKYPQEYGPLVEQYLKNLSDTPESDRAK